MRNENKEKSGWKDVNNARENTKVMRTFDEEKGKACK